MPSEDLLDTPELVRSFQQGDRGALEELFSRYLGRVRKIVSLRMGSYLRSLHDPEDVVQTAMLSVFKSLDSVSILSQGSFRNWVAKCVQNEIVDMARIAKAGRRSPPAALLKGDAATALLSSVVDPNAFSPAALAQAHELEAKIEAELPNLEPHHREVIILRHLCDMNFQEIAGELGFASESHARTSLTRALEKLRARLGIE